MLDYSGIARFVCKYIKITKTRQILIFFLLDITYDITNSSYFETDNIIYELIPT
jgi:hypothetical protein